MASPVHLSSRAPLSPRARRPRTASRRAVTLARHARSRRLARARGRLPRRGRPPRGDPGPAPTSTALPLARGSLIRVSRRGRSPRVALVRASASRAPRPSPRAPRARPRGPRSSRSRRSSPASPAPPALADGRHSRSKLREKEDRASATNAEAPPRRGAPRVDHPRGRRRGDGGLQEREEGARHPGRPRRARAQARDEEAQEESRPRGERTQQRRVPPRDVSSREADHAAGRVHGPLGLRLRPTPAVDRRPLLLGDPPRRRVGGDQSLRPRRLWRIRVPPPLLRVALRVPPPTPARRGVRSLGHRPEPRRARDLGRGREDPIAPRRRSG